MNDSCFLEDISVLFKCFLTLKMSTGSSPVVEPTHSRRSVSTYNNDDITEVNSSTPLIHRPVKRSKKVRICTLCGRYDGFRMPRYLFILLCIAIVLLILLIAAVILLYVVVPVIVRSAITKANLDFRSVNIVQIEDHGFRLQADLELSNTGSIPATIIPPFVIHVDDVGTVTNTEKISITGGSNNSTIIPIDAPFMITNMDAFNNFSRSLIFQPNVIWHLKADATIRPISSYMLSYSNIPFNKEVKLNAFNGLRDVSINSISLNRSDAQNIIVDIVIKIRNPSVFGIDLGK
jgi:hypothetical protein